MMEKKVHLPFMGVGPVYVAVIVILTIVGGSLKFRGRLVSGTVAFMKIPFMIVGGLLIIIGILLWARAVFESKIDKHIESNTLVTTGVYAYVRNPIYSGIMVICTGTLFWMNNLWLLILPVIYWLFMTVLMKKTEEKWLRELYGQKYIDYCQQVNRVIPWVRKRIK